MSPNKLTLAQVSWSDEEVPISQKFDDVYFSTDDGLAEVDHTFVQPSNFARRFAEVEAKQTFRIAETGFGSGLNFLMVAQLWLQKANPLARLHFISFEKYPLALKDLKRVHQALPGLVTPAQSLQENYPILLPGWHDVWLFEGRIRLTLWFGDVLKGLPQCDASQGSLVDAWLLDGFAPAKNPDMWQPALYQQMARLSHLHTSFATFTAAGEVRRALSAIGFEVHKASGFGKKREMCFGQLTQQRPYSLKAPWFSRPEPIAQKESALAIVIGAGLAGAAVAHKLATAGLQVKVLEAEDEVATQASGNLAGAVHPLITADWSVRSQWYLQGFEATLRTLKPWLENAITDTNRQEEDSLNHLLGDLTGLVQLLVNETSHKRVTEAFERVGLPREFICLLTQQEASGIVGTETSTSAVFFPQGGWLYPKAVIQKSLEHPNIELLTQQNVLAVKRTSEESSWSVITANAQYQADIVVVATGSLDSQLNNQLGLPIRPVKGQVSHVKAAQQNVILKTAVTHEGYSVSCGDGWAVTGATFESPDMTSELSLAGHEANLKQTKNALPNWLKVKPEDCDGRIAFRPTTPDHLPIIGAVPEPQWMQEAYLSQSHTHAVYRYPKQQYQGGLYVSNGHGPRGLMSVFLAAEVVLAEIQGEALPQPLSLYHASHPARFAIRQWRSGRQNSD